MILEFGNTDVYSFAASSPSVSNHRHGVISFIASSSLLVAVSRKTIPQTETHRRSALEGAAESGATQEGALEDQEARDGNESRDRLSSIQKGAAPGEKTHVEA